MLLLLGLTIPACAGEVENAIAKGDNVFLYLHSPSCKYYNGQYSFFKVDTTTKYGHELMYEFGGTYVPYVVLINGKKKAAMHIPPACLLDNVCLEAEMKEFRK